MWKYPEDRTAPVLTAAANIASSHRWNRNASMPETAILFFMSGGVEYLCENYSVEVLGEKFPRFLRPCPIYAIRNQNICFLNGGSGAPMAADTLETLAALGVKRAVAIGMFGTFSEKIACGEIIVPKKAFVEEGTSLHYYEELEFAQPDLGIQAHMAGELGAETFPVVSTDAVYRQTFYKEALWREKGAVGVDMETSAVFSVGAYLGLQTAAVLISSDRHPLTEGGSKWEWHMTWEQRAGRFDRGMDAILKWQKQQQSGKSGKTPLQSGLNSDIIPPV